MATSNVGTATSRTDYDVRTHRSNSKPHNAQAKPEQPSGGNPPKEDTVTISEEGIKRLNIVKLEGPIEFTKEKWQQKGTPEYEEYWKSWKEEMEKNLTEYRIGWLGISVKGTEGMFENAWEIGRESDFSHTSYAYKKQAEESIFKSLDGKAGIASGDVVSQLASMIFSTKDTDLETRAANREAARDLVKRITENFMIDPKNSKVDQKEAQAFIDEVNKHIEYSELIDKGYVDKGNGLEPPDPMSDTERFMLANWDKYFGHLGVNPNVNEYNQLSCDSKALSYDAFHALNKAYSEAYKTAENAYIAEHTADAETVDYKADFLAKSNLVQNIIDNAKLIKDFYGNERWNSVMNLITEMKSRIEQRGK